MDVIIEFLRATQQPVAAWYFIFTLLVAGIAQGKNRSGSGWWLLTVFTGPIALICLVVLVEKKHPKPEPNPGK